MRFDRGAGIDNLVRISGMVCLPAKPLPGVERRKRSAADFQLFAKLRYF
jgi:hypothetical protein